MTPLYTGYMAPSLFRTLAIRRALALSMVLLLLPSCSNVRNELPDEIEIAEVIASSSSGFFIEGCASVVYRLSPTAIGTLENPGAAFFRNIRPPRNENPKNPYTAWRSTPVPEVRQANIHAVNAIGGCDGSKGEFHAPHIERALSTPGSFYAVTANEEGMILIMPRTGIAAFLYFG
jgi:hypothetical protein